MVSACRRSRHPRFWDEVGLSARKADVIVEKDFFHYRMFYATTSFHDLPVTSAGATSLAAVRARLGAASATPAAQSGGFSATQM